MKKMSVAFWMISFALFSFGNNAYADLQFHCKEIADSLQVYCKFAVLVPGDNAAEIRFTIKQGEIKSIPDIYLGRKFCYDRAFERNEELSLRKVCTTSAPIA